MTGFAWRLQGRAYVLGHDVPHPNVVIPQWVIDGRHVDPEFLIPHLFSEVDPGFHERVRAGDIVVAGRNFGMGPKMNGYIAMQALGLGLVCESMPFFGYRGAVGCGLRVLTDCPGIADATETGDELVVDFSTGAIENITQGRRHVCPPMPDLLRDIVAKGGNTGWLRDWWAEQQAATGS